MLRCVLACYRLNAAHLVECGCSFAGRGGCLMLRCTYRKGPLDGVLFGGLVQLG